MPGHEVARSSVKNSALFDKYQCPHCRLLLKNAVQPLCGHWLCESCAENLLASLTPKCPIPNCQEKLKDDSEEGADYFPDRFVRREIEGLVVTCTYKKKGCDWEDKLPKFEAHLKTCEYASEECPQCGETLAPDQLETHDQICPSAVAKCPLADHGCSYLGMMTRSELKAHVADHGVEHLTVIADVVKLLEQGNKTFPATGASIGVNEGYATGQLSTQAIVLSSHAFGVPLPETQLPGHSRIKSVGEPDSLIIGVNYIEANKQFGETLQSEKATPKKVRQVVEDVGYWSQSSMSIERVCSPRVGISMEEERPGLSEIASKLKIEMEGGMRADLRRKDEEIGILRNTITKLEKSMRSKHAEFEDRDFRLSLIENSSYDGSMVWKIPQFSQRMSDTQTGKYTSIFSLPFYTNIGYKMCLRLYILGDGIGKNTHMSLFFVIMRGEFDSILQWPFTHKVTFKLINQTGGRNIIDTFQPDPMSNSVCKPKSDMNIASGCPRFVSHDDLKNGGFIVEDSALVEMHCQLQ